MLSKPFHDASQHVGSSRPEVRPTQHPNAPALRPVHALALKEEKTRLRQHVTQIMDWKHVEMNHTHIYIHT